MRRAADLVRPIWTRIPERLRGSRFARGIRERILGVRVIRTLAELDQELERLDTSTYDDEKAIFASFRMKVDRGPELDPSSDTYRQREIALYEFISGKPYAPSNDITSLDVDGATTRPFPYSTRSARGVGDHLKAIGHAISCIDLPPGSSILEFGPGWGNLTIALARMGYDVTAVDIAPDFLEVIRRRAAQEACEVTLIEGDFFIAIDRRFDAVVFFESFHHCVDHRALVRRLAGLTEKVVFAGEPITKHFDVPWGVRLDGESLWAMRRNGWFECGFREDYFLRLLREEGWDVTKHIEPNAVAGTAFVATR